MDNQTASIPLMLKQLRLATMVQHWDTLGRKAVKEQWSPQQYLSELCHIELSSREDKRLQRLLTRLIHESSQSDSFSAA